MLLNLQRIKTQTKRGLDLIELRIRREKGLSNFKVDNLIVAVKDETSFSIPPVFSRITSAFTGVGSASADVTVKGSFAY